MRAWLANLELVYVSWKMDCLSKRIQDLSDPYHSRNLSEELSYDLDSISVDTFLKQNSRFKSVRDVIEIQLRLLMGADLNRISMLYLLTFAKSQGLESFSAFLLQGGTTTNKAQWIILPLLNNMGKSVKLSVT